ncbi:hypothetical protein CYMTET_8295 [Cymbomonas tetramitiformis]|uniref:Peptidase M24 domain-containing protein n=1 Tax=Cymbomonas tetramitiformis TaxID=36881 RepID=A0AAE0LG82_9CHLO|nr:hypothetical protein CYMTET_8295 [Cymbomonas tetramitiformis]
MSFIEFSSTALQRLTADAAKCQSARGGSLNATAEKVRKACKVCVECMRVAECGLQSKDFKNGMEVANAVGICMLKNKCHSACMCDGDGFEYPCCVSVNDCAAHGTPTTEPFQDGDLIKVDIVVHHGEGGMGDMARTFIYGESQSDAHTQFVLATKRLLRVIVDNFNKRSTRNRAALESEMTEQYNEFESTSEYFVMRDLTGHRIGARMHLKPFIGNGNTDVPLAADMTVCIEPVTVLANGAPTSSKFVSDHQGNIRSVHSQNRTAHHENTYVIDSDLKLQPLTCYN